VTVGRAFRHAHPAPNLIIVLICVAPAHAEQRATAGLTVTGFRGAPVFADSGSSIVYGDDLAAFSVNPNIQYIDVGASATARPGRLRVYAKADSNNPGTDFLTTHQVSASSTWITNGVVNVPGVAAGTAGTAVARYSVLGSLGWDNQGTLANYSGSGFVSGSITVNGNAAAVNYEGRYVWIQGSGYWRVTRMSTGESDQMVVNNTSPQGFGGYGFSDVLEVPFSFVTGQSVSIRAEMNAYGRSQSSGSGAGLDWTSDGGNSAYWLGLSDVTIGGSPVNNVTFLDTETGANLALASTVPLPAPLALLALGVSILLRTRRS
jgi:hypothetical protein